LFLEELLWKRYKESVPLIIPLLGKEYRSTVRKLDTVSKELRSQFVLSENVYLILGSLIVSY